MELFRLSEALADIFKDVNERNVSELKILKKYLEMIKSSNVDPDNFNKLHQLANQYTDVIEKESKILSDFSMNIKEIGRIFEKDDEMMSEIKVLSEKIQAESIDQIQELSTKK